MALQLTPMMGTTAYPDRMGDYHPELLKTDRIVQGYSLSGAMTPETMSAVNQDLDDSQWRRLFHTSLLNDGRFQRGLFTNPKDGATKPTETPQDPEWHQFHTGDWQNTPFAVEMLQTLSHRRLHGEEAIHFEYGWALIKTAASLLYTIQLCQKWDLAAATDSFAHYDLLRQTCKRKQLPLENICIKREGY